MATGVTYECASLPSWTEAECCAGCHDPAADTRPVRMTFPFGYPLNVADPLLPVDSHRVLCCRSTYHAWVAMAGVPTYNADDLDLAAPPTMWRPA